MKNLTLAILVSSLAIVSCVQPAATPIVEEVIATPTFTISNSNNPLLPPYPCEYKDDIAFRVAFEEKPEKDYSGTVFGTYPIELQVTPSSESGLGKMLTAIILKNEEGIEEHFLYLGIYGMKSNTHIEFDYWKFKDIMLCNNLLAAITLPPAGGWSSISQYNNYLMNDFPIQSSAPNHRFKGFIEWGNIVEYK
ncbi:MAG: hypothetical protein AABW92_05600 [Nanoarchaeota archaeon]